MSGWRRCERCRRVLAGEEFDGDDPVVPGLPRRPRRGRAEAGQGRTGDAHPQGGRAAARGAPVEAGPRQPLLGVAGSGDYEVRERRARRAANEALAEAHPEEFEELLAAARRVEGLRA